jgi:hypothetical protein
VKAMRGAARRVGFEQASQLIRLDASCRSLCRCGSQVNSIVLTSPHLGHLYVRKPYSGLGIAASSRLQRRSPPPGKVLIPVRLPILIALEDVFDRGPRKPLVLSHDYRATRPHNFLSERQEYVWLLHLGVTIKPTGLEHSIHRSEHSRFGV